MLSKEEWEKRDEERENDTYLECKYHLTLPIRYKKQISKKGIDIQDYYRDQNPNRGSLVSSWYLPYGLKKFDSFFCKMITERKLPYDQIKNMILRNPHLHNVIKTNLLENLENNGPW
jgi:hypothetical protein